VVGVCLAAFLGNQFILSPLQAAWQGNQEAIAGLNKNISDGTSLLNRQLAIKRQWDDMTSHSLPLDNSLALDMVVKSVERWTQQSGFRRSSLKPQWTLEQKDRGELEIHITGQGTIKQVSNFIYLLESDPLPLRVEEETVAQVDPNGNNLSLTVRFTALQIRDKAPKPVVGRGARGTTSNRGGI